MRQYEVTVLFENAYLGVARFDCSGPVCHAEGEEAAEANEIVFPLSGVFLKRDRFSETLADAGSAVFFNKDQPYEIDHPSGHSDNSIILRPGPDLIREMERNFGRLLSSEPDRMFAHPDLPLGYGDRMELARVLGYFVRHGASEESGTFEAVCGLLERLDARASGRRTGLGAAGMAGPFTRNRRLARDAVVYLNENFESEVKLPNVAEAVGSSIFHLCRLFRAYTGQTINQYLTRLRLSRSLDLLAQPELPVTAIAFDLGFASHSHFTSRFLEKFGFSPSQARSFLR